jgi:hypothetical protein
MGVAAGVHTPAWTGLSNDVTINNAGQATVNALRNRTVANVSPNNGEVLTWSTGNNRWEPAASSVSSMTFANITNGTNIQAAMHVSTGASLDAINNGTIEATSLKNTSAAGSSVIAALTTNGGTLTNNTSGNALNVTGTVAIANGGTGQTTAQASLNALAGATTSGQYLRGNGANVVMSAIQAGDVPTLNQSTTGNAATATQLATSRNINGIAFNGTADITVAAAASTLTGSTLASGVTASSLTSVGTLGSLTVTNPIAGSVTGTSSGLTGTNLTGDVTNSGNTVTVTKIQGRAIDPMVS